MKVFLFFLGLVALLSQEIKATPVGNGCSVENCIHGSCQSANGIPYCDCVDGYFGPACDLSPIPCDATQGVCSSPANLNFVSNPVACISFNISNVPTPLPPSATLNIQVFSRQNLPRNQAVTISQSMGGYAYLSYDFIFPNLNSTQENLFYGTVFTDNPADPYSFEIDLDVIGPVPRIRALIPMLSLISDGVLMVCPYDLSYVNPDKVHLDQVIVTFFNLFDPCQSNPCLNGGVCSSTGDIFTCDCTATGYSGNICQGCLTFNSVGTLITSQDSGFGGIMLSSQPSAPVTVFLEADCATFEKCSLTFTPADWNTMQPFFAYASTNSTDDTGCRLRAKVSSNDICNDDVSINDFVLVISEQFYSYHSPPTRHVTISAGDPHFDTFDGKHHDFYDVGDFYFVRQLNGDFAVQTRQLPCNGVACNAAVAVKYKTALFFLAIVNGAPSISSANLLAEDIKVTGSGSVYTLTTPNKIEVTMDVRYWFGTQYYMNVQVQVPETLHFQLVGLGGFFDADVSNDLMMPDGQVTDDVNAFQQSWRVPTSENLLLDANAVIPPLSDIFPTPVPTEAPTEAPAPGPKGVTCKLPDSDDITTKLPNTPVSPVANETVPLNEDFEPPTCDFTDPALEAAAKADCGTYFNDTVAQCCVSLGVNGDNQYAACLCDYKFAGNADFIMDSVTPFYSLCQQKAATLNTTCAPCPRACSGHGSCGTGGVCTCNSGFHGDDCGEDWSTPPTVASATPSSSATCSVGATVVVTGNNFFGTDLTCLFNDVTTVPATKMTTYQVSCPLPLPRSLGAMTVKVSRDGMTSATGASFTFVETCCESPCERGTCNDVTNGFSCDCTGTTYSGSRCEIAPTNCPSETLNGVTWPSIAASTSATASCPSGSSGTQSRLCQASSTWADIVSTCTPIPPCPAAADYAHASWPETPYGQTATGTCVAGYSNSPSGPPTRKCPANGGLFASSVTNLCVRNQCPTVTEGGVTWNQTNSFNFIKVTCSPGQIGGPSRTCQADGTWGSISGTCTTAASTCSTNSYSFATWPETNVGAVATGTCDSGYFGSPKRQCNQDGSWSASVTSFCQRRTCSSVSEGNAQWNVTNSLTTFYAKCDNGYSGTPSRPCLADGSWGSIVNPCIQIAGTCPQGIYNRADWPATSAGATAYGTCIPGWSGSPNRICKADGTWQDLVRNLCTKN